jgi:flagellar biosynthesis protein FlhA
MINIVGGFFIGLVQHDMHWMDAAATYTILTVGDGLVSQIPAIIISTASGLIVARAASGDDLGNEVMGQLGSSAKPLFISSAVCLGFALIPGLPFIPFMVLALGTGTLGLLRNRLVAPDAKVTADETRKKKEEESKPRPGSKEEVTSLLGIDTLELEVGYELVALVEGGDLVERIRSLRRQFAIDYGFIVPPIHIRDNVRIKPSQYRLMLRGAVIGSGELKSHHLLAMDPGNVSAPVPGTPTKEPAFGLEALWISEGEKERAQFSGYTVVDLPTVIVTHLTELVRSNMQDMLGRQEVQHLLDNLHKEYPKVVDELVPNLLSLGQIQQVLQHLLREQVSIRDLRTILETLADWAPNLKHTEKLAEYVRRKLSRSITAKFVSAEGTLPLASLNPGLERALSEAVQQTDEGSFLALEPSQAQVLINRMGKLAEKFVELGQTPLLLAPTHLRAALSRFAERFVPGFVIISHQEIAPNTRVQSLGVISIE